MRRRTARELALRVLRQVEERGSFADDLLRAELSEGYMPVVDRALAFELVQGVLRWQKRIDWILGQHVETPLQDMTSWVRNILRLGVYQLCFLDRVPAPAAVNESVKLAHRYGHPGTVKLVNAVLRAVARRSEPHLPGGPSVEVIALEYSFPEWLVERWVNRWGEERTRQLCAAINRVPPLTVRVNMLRTTPEELMEELCQEGVKAERTSIAAEGLRLRGGGDVTRLRPFLEGLFQMQDEGSILVGYVVSPSSGAMVLDACAGVGIKTTHLAQFMKNDGFILAMDANTKRLGQMGATCQRLGVDIVRAVVGDATRSLPIGIEFDVVFVDAPCSGLGALRRHPEAKWLKRPETVKEMSVKQSLILGQVAGFTKPGGLLVYSTCSTEPEENEEVVAGFLSSNEEFMLENTAPWLPPQARKFADSSGFFRVLPGEDDMDGFFVARLRRRGLGE